MIELLFKIKILTLFRLIESLKLKQFFSRLLEL